MKKYFRICYGALLILSLGSRGAESQALQAPDGIVSSYLNAGLPGWIRFAGEDRMRLESLDGVAFQNAGNTYLLDRLRLNLDIHPVAWLKFSFQAQDSRVWFTNVSPAPSSQKDPMDLRLGYVQLGDVETGRLSLRAGRQNLTFGEGRLMADPNWSNVGRSLDGVRLTIRYRKLRLDAFSGATDKISTDGFDTPTPGEHVHGLYGSLDRVIPNAVLEPYVFWRLEHNVKGEQVKSGNLDEKTMGLRWVGKLPINFDYGLEMALGRGSQAGEPIASWAGHWVLGYTFTDTWYQPRLFAELNRASGDANPRDGVHGAFDTLFPSAHDKFGVADQFTWTNIVHARAGLQLHPHRRLALGGAYDSFWLANRQDGIYSGGKIIIASNGLQGNHIGQEADVQAQWNLARHTLVDIAYGHIFPGEFLRKAGRGTSYNCYFLAATQRF